MIKPASLRAALAKALPTLRRDPDKLQVFIDQGQLVATQAASLSFEYRYRLNLILTDYAHDIDPLMVAVLAWIRQHQPELLDHALRAHDIAFAVDYLNQSSCDLSITLPLTERVIVTTRQDGSHQIAHVDELLPDGVAE